jgi:hypothetical protein
MLKQYKKKVDEVLLKMWKSKESVIQCITRIHREKWYYETEREKINSFYTDLSLNLFLNDFSEEFESGLYFEIKGTVYIHKDDLQKFLDNIDFCCWERDLDHKYSFNNNYYKFKIKRWYYSIAKKQLFYM